MKLNALLGIYCLLLGSCSGGGLSVLKPAVDVEIVNQSTRDLQNAGVRFGEHTCEWGVVGQKMTKIYMLYPHPIPTHAELQWEEPKGRRVEKLDLSNVYRRGESGRLTFNVYDDRVEVSFRAET